MQKQVSISNSGRLKLEKNKFRGTLTKDGRIFLEDVSDREEPVRKPDCPLEVRYSAWSKWAAGALDAAEMLAFVESSLRRLCAFVSASRWLDAEKFSAFVSAGISEQDASEERALRLLAPGSVFGIPVELRAETVKDAPDALYVRPSDAEVAVSAVGRVSVETAEDFSAALSPFGSRTLWDCFGEDGGIMTRAEVLVPGANEPLGVLGTYRGIVMSPPADPERQLLPALAPPDLVPEIAAGARRNPPDVRGLVWRKPDDPEKGWLLP